MHSVETPVEREHGGRPQWHLEGPRIDRFALTERLLHWWTVAMFTIALLTGFWMGNELRRVRPSSICTSPR